MEQRNTHIFLGMIGLAVALIICSLIVADAARDVKKANDTISVTGSAKRPITSDFAVWRGAVTARKPTMQAAYQVIKQHAERLEEYFKTNGIPDTAVSFDPISSWAIEERDEQNRETGRIVAYNVRQNFEVRSADVKMIDDLSKQASELMGEGINLESYSPEYLVTYLSELRSEMLAEASADAHRRALSMAESVGSKVGALRNARMGVFQITARNSTDISDYGMYDTRALEKDITAVVRLTFAIE